jgi:rhomboid family GlyGly-CTERM serine protease
VHRWHGEASFMKIPAAAGDPFVRFSIACSAVMMLLWALLGAASGLHYQRASFLAGAFWQALTAQLVHLSAVHALVNAIALIAIALGFLHRLAYGPQFAVLCAAWASVALGLMLDANCSYYAGASGALHGLIAGNALLLMVRGKGAGRWLGLLTLAVFTAKLAVEALHDNASTAGIGWTGVAVYPPAHWWGSGGGLLGALLILAYARGRRDTRFAKSGK